MGELSILNVGAGDNKIVIGDNPADKIRAARVINDMLRRGYALLVEIERDGEKAYERAVGFDERHCCYIIADFDPAGGTNGEATTDEAAEAGVGNAAGEARSKRGGRKSVDATTAKAHAVGRSAGG